MWKEDHTVDEISFETGIPRSTVGYYVRKFNKRAKRGEPIAFRPDIEKPDEKTMAITAFAKDSVFFDLMRIAREEKDVRKKSIH